MYDKKEKTLASETIKRLMQPIKGEPCPFYDNVYICVGRGIKTCIKHPCTKPTIGYHPTGIPAFETSVSKTPIITTDYEA